MSNAPDLQPKVATPPEEEKKIEDDETLEKEAEDEEDEEEDSDSDDDDDVQITIGEIQAPTIPPYGRSQSYTKMSIPPGGMCVVCVCVCESVCRCLATKVFIG